MADIQLFIKREKKKLAEVAAFFNISIVFSPKPTIIKIVFFLTNAVAVAVVNHRLCFLRVNIINSLQLLKPIQSFTNPSKPPE